MPTEQTDTTQTPPEEITYTPTVWADGADGGTPINAANLNNMEEAIVALVERTTKQVVTSMIADGAVTLAKCDQSLRDSVSQKTKVIRVSKTKAQWGSGSRSMFTAPEVDGWKFSHWGPPPVADGFSAAMCYSTPEKAASNVWRVYCEGWDNVTAVHSFAVYNRQA